MNVFDFRTEIQKRKKREVYSSELGAVATDLKNPQKKYTIINMMLGAKYILTPLKYKRHGQKVDCYSKRNLGDSPPQVTPQVAPVTEEKILEFCSVPRSRAELLEYLKLSDHKNLRTKYLNPLLASGKLKMTIPNKPNSRLQKYVRA